MKKTLIVINAVLLAAIVAVAGASLFLRFYPYGSPSYSHEDPFVMFSVEQTGEFDIPDEKDWRYYYSPDNGLNAVFASWVTPEQYSIQNGFLNVNRHLSTAPLADSGDSKDEFQSGNGVYLIRVDNEVPAMFHLWHDWMPKTTCKNVGIKTDWGYSVAINENRISITRLYDKRKIPLQQIDIPQGIIAIEFHAHLLSCVDETAEYVFKLNGKTLCSFKDFTPSGVLEIERGRFEEIKYYGGIRNCSIRDYYGFIDGFPEDTE
ncbi:MAG: hypothetical protein IK105_10260 [Thermoguttaceae bacterium]|nr:hypothetical protein [Thermoguttaceae bacterium]